MATISYARHQFPPEVIRHPAWLYLRFTLSYRDAEDMLAERGLDVSYETVRRWVAKFGPLFTHALRKLRPRPTGRWHLDEMAVTIAGTRHWLWCAVDDEGLEAALRPRPPGDRFAMVLDILVQPRRNKSAAVRFLRNTNRPDL